MYLDYALSMAKQHDTIRTVLEAIFGAELTNSMQRGTEGITDNSRAYAFSWAVARIGTPVYDDGC